MSWESAGCRSDPLGCSGCAGPGSRARLAQCGSLYMRAMGLEASAPALRAFRRAGRSSHAPC